MVTLAWSQAFLALPMSSLLQQGGLADSLGTLPSSFLDGSGYWGLLFRAFLSLGAILLILYLSVRLVLPRLVRWRVGSATGMALIDRLPLGGTRSLCVVRAAGKYYLVGVTDGSVQLLSELAETEVEGHYPATLGRPGRDG